MLRKEIMIRNNLLGSYYLELDGEVKTFQEILIFIEENRNKTSMINFIWGVEEGVSKKSLSEIHKLIDEHPNHFL